MAGAEYALDDPQVLADEIAEPDFEQLLAEPAAAISLHVPEIEEASVYKPKEFDEAKHPRWPKGTPKAGQFMRAGESFISDGKRWQIVSTAGNEVLAAEASGDVKAVEMKVFKPTEKISLKATKPLNVGAGDALPAAWNKNPDLIPVGTKIKSSDGMIYERVVDGDFKRVAGYGSFTAEDSKNALDGYVVVSVPPQAEQHAVKGVAVPGIEVAPPKRIKGGAYSSDADFPVSFAGGENVTIVDPYVHSETHDPAIPVPAGSKLSAEDWKRFGKDDQAYYTELMDRFGAWKAQDASATMAAAYNAYKASIRDVIHQGFKLQYGPGYWGDSGGGRGLSLAYLFTHANKGPELEKAYKKYEESKVALDEMNEVVHWDLYNRTRSPDITLFHGGGTSINAYNKQYISGKTPIYAGYSQSYNLNAAAGWGDTISATPVRVPYVALSVYSQVPGMSMEGEREIAVGARMKLSDRSVVFSGQSMGMSGYTATAAVRKWLDSQTKLQPAGGSLVDDLKAVWNGEGPIPIPEEKLVLQLEGSTEGSTYKLPPADWQAKAIGMAGTLKYKSDDGSKEHAVGILASMGLSAGDFIEGKQGARYVIIPDSGDTHGLRYVKLKSSSGVEVSDFGTSFPFTDSQSNEFYRLNGHLDLPKEKAEKGFTPFGPTQYAKLAVGAKTKAGSLGVGEMFKYDGEGYKVTGKLGSQVSVESLDTGKKYKANTLGVVLPLVATEGFHAPSEFVAGDRVIFTLPSGKIGLGTIDSINESQAKVSWAYGEQTLPVDTLMPGPEAPGLKPEQAQKGDKFSHLGVGPYTVTAVLKSGTIKAKLSGKNVESFSPDALAGDVIFRPSTFAIGEKVKLKTLAIGALVNGPSKKLHPYLVEAKANEKGQLVYLRNLETGVLTPVSGNKSYAVLKDAMTIHHESEALPTPGATKPGNFVFDPSKYTLGAKTTINQLSQGDLFVGTSGTKYKIVAPSAVYGKKWQVEVVEPGPSGAKAVGEQFNFTGSSSGTPLLAKESVPFDGHLSLGDQTAVANLNPGDTFLPAPGTPQFYAPAGMKWVVSSKTLSGMKVKVIKPDGSATNSEMDVPFGAGYPVIYHGPNEYVPGKGAGGGEIDPGGLPTLKLHDDFPNAPYTYDSFKWHKAGSGLKYPKLKSMAVGTVFTDKSDKAWKIKQAGAGTLVISDGQQLYAADPNWRGLVDEDGSVAFIDNPELAEQPGTSNMPNLGALEPGDKFVMPAGKPHAGEVYEVVGPGLSSLTTKVKNVATGTELNLNKNALVPAAVVKAPPQQEAPVGDLAYAQSQISALNVGESVTLGDVVVTRTAKGLGQNWLIEKPGALPLATNGAMKAAAFASGHTPWGSAAQASYSGVVANQPPGSSKFFTQGADLVALYGSHLPGQAGSPLAPGDPLSKAYKTMGDLPVGLTFAYAGDEYTITEQTGLTTKFTAPGGAASSNKASQPVAEDVWTFVSGPTAPPKGVGQVKPPTPLNKLEVGDSFLNKPPNPASKLVTDKPDDYVFTITKIGKAYIHYQGEDGVSAASAITSLNGGKTVTVVASPGAGPQPGDKVSDHFPTFGDIPIGTKFQHANVGAVYEVVSQSPPTIQWTSPSTGVTKTKIYNSGYKPPAWTIVSMGGQPTPVAGVGANLKDTFKTWGNVPDGTKFKSASPTIYTATKIAGGKVKLTWGTGGTNTYSDNDPINHDGYEVVELPPGAPRAPEPVDLSDSPVGGPAVYMWPTVPDIPVGTVIATGFGANQYEVIKSGVIKLVHGSAGPVEDGLTYPYDAGTTTPQSWKIVSLPGSPTAPKTPTVGDVLKKGDIYTFTSGDPPVLNTTLYHVKKHGPKLGYGIVTLGQSDLSYLKADAAMSSPPVVLNDPSKWNPGDVVKGDGSTFKVAALGTGEVWLHDPEVDAPGVSKPMSFAALKKKGYLLSALAGGAGNEPQVGDEMLGDLSHLPIGTTVTAFKPPAPGGEYEITGYDKDAPRGVTVSFLAASGTPVPSTLAAAPPEGSGSYWIKSLPGVTGKQIGSPEAHTTSPTPKQTAAKEIGSPLQAYKYHKSGGGGYNYPKLGSLSPGTIFTDKTKTEYKLVSVQGDTAYFTKLADGNSSLAPQFAAPAKSFVHVLSDLDLMSEARLVFTTGGRVALVGA